MRRFGGFDRWLACLLVTGLCWVGCKDTDAENQLNIYAASSLAEAFRALTHGFVERHPNANVSVTFAGSQVLRLQIEQGATADVVATANPEHMQSLTDGGFVSEKVVFAHNALAIVVPLNNPAQIEAFSDLPRAKRLVLGTEGVPVGRYAQQMLSKAEAQFTPDFVRSIQQNVVSKENNTRLVRAKVALGEADAAIVYRTDAVSSAEVKRVEIPPALNVRAEYLQAVLSTSQDNALARAWMTYVSSPAGQAILAQHGFEVD